MWFPFFTGKEFLGNLIKVEFAEKRVPKGGFRGGGGRGTVSVVNDYNGMSFLLIYEVIRLFCLLFCLLYKEFIHFEPFLHTKCFISTVCCHFVSSLWLLLPIFLMKFKFVIHGFKVKVASRATRSERAQNLFLHQFGQWSSKMADLLVDGTWP